MKWNDSDLEQFRAKGINLNEIEEQLQRFREGFPFIQIDRPATIGDGIERLTAEEISGYAHYYEQRRGLKPMKFVPASGAASRMFKDLFSFRENFDQAENPDIFSIEKLKPVFDFFQNLEKFAFYDDLEHVMKKKGSSLEKAVEERRYNLILDFLLDEMGLNYGALPKGLLKFHKYPSGSRTPVEEHLVEAAHYSRSDNGDVHVHFTVSPEFTEAFRDRASKAAADFEKQFKARYDISFSVQQNSTDTIAVDMNNEPFRDEDGSILFRPGGHGALLYNLNQLDYDLVFIKNIDNVAPDRLKEETYRYKKALAGLLLDRQQKIFDYLRKLEKPDRLTGQELDEMLDFTTSKLCVQTGGVLLSADEKVDFLRRKLNRPIRVCGMVRNEGEPGGGPYFARNQDGTASLQIIESSQVEMKNEAQKRIFSKATHFNPVDLAIAVRDYKGRKFDLKNFVDPETGFISKKSKSGRDLKALELPGLWNGSMSDWNTLFMEVPAETFNPVKTVNDLLRSGHQ